MKLLNSTLLGFAIALALAAAPSHGHSFGYQGGGMHGAFDPEKLSDDYLDRIGALMTERFQSMQRIASEQDTDERRKLVREHFDTMSGYHRGADDDDSQYPRQHGMMGYGMGSGAMGYGMGPGMMGYGMGPGMMGSGSMHGTLNDEYLDKIAEHMVDSHSRMSEIAGTTDKAKRRELVRKHFDEMRDFMESMHDY